MRQQQTPQFTCGHPSLDAASVLLAEFIEARNELARTKDWLGRCLEEVRPTKWTKAIEAAVGKPDELERLHIEHREKSVTLACVYLRESVVRELAWELSDKLRATQTALVAEHDAMDQYAPNASVKPLLRAAVVSITAEINGRREFERADGKDDRAMKCLREAANVVAAYVANASPYGYTSDLVVNAHKLSGLARGVDFRNAFPVALRDKDKRWPKAEALHELLLAFEEALKSVRNASKDLRSDNNGSVNEVQHAHRLVAHLYGESCGQLNADLVDAQNDRRIQYEIVLRRFRTQVELFKALRIKVAEALKEAVGEAKAAGALDNTPRMAINQHVIDVEVRAINNLVAADDMLRRYGRELSEHERTAQEDASKGAGSRAVEAEFERIAGFERPRIEKSKSA